MDKKYILNFCKEKDFEYVKSLDSNDRKDTAVILVKSNIDQNHFVIKFFGNHAPKYSIDSIKKEISFYKNNKSEFLLNSKITGDNFICLEYLGHSLFDIIEKKIQNNSEKIFDDEFLKNIKRILDWFHSLDDEYTYSKKNNKLVIDSLFERFGNLISSGPKGTHRPNFEYFILRQLYKLFSSKLKKNLTNIVNLWSQKNCKILSAFGHNDLHCRNILSSEDAKNLKIIDFENLKTPGSWLSDMLYFYATLHACFSSKSEFKIKIKKQALFHIQNKENKLHQKEISYLVDLFFLAAEVNSRWRINSSGIKFGKIFHLGYMLFRNK